MVAGVQGGNHMPPQNELAALAAQNPAWQKFHQAELDAAEAAFPCSQATDRTYVSLFLERLSRKG